MPPQHRYSLPPQSKLRHYVVNRLLGHGGFGMTYLAEDTQLMRQVAIKELLPNDFATRESDGTTVVARSSDQVGNLNWARTRFIEEARTLAALHHPSILPVHEFFEGNGTAYLVTAFIEGVTFEDWLRKYGIPSEEALVSLTMDLLDALQLVHEHEFLHRDIKTENILIERKQGKPVLIDFGNARISTGQKTASITAVLTAGYAPFEQYSTKGKQGPWTDLYALGAVLHRAITGSVPEDSAARVIEDNLPRLSANPPEGFSAAFLATVDRALEMRAQDRWQTCQQWKDALLSNCAPPPPGQEATTVEPAVGAGPIPQASAPRPASKKNPALVALVVLGLAAVVSGGAYFAISGGGDTANANQSSGNSAGSKTIPPVLAPENDGSPAAAKPEEATADLPFRNSIGMKFVPVEITNGGKPTGRKILFATLETRNRDFMQWKSDHDDEGSPNKPVTGVSFYEDALGFCRWLSEKEKRTYRLPTDHEWSCAAGLAEAEGGNVGADNRDFRNVQVGGGDPFAGVEAPTGNGNVDAGKGEANGLGIHDLAGNAAEWTATIQDEPDVSHPHGTIVIRGAADTGLVSSGSQDQKVLVDRRCRDPFQASPEIGFRCVIVP